jgi:putative DNA primase/helicase
MPDEFNITDQPAFKERVADAEAANQAARLEVDDARPPEYSDESLALRLAAKHGNDIRYVSRWGKWLLWSGAKWDFDETMRVFSMSRAICRAASAEPEVTRGASAIASAKTVAATVSLARADRRIAATVDQWDEGEWLLNTPKGIVDLRTGQISPNDPLRYMTRTTACVPGGDCPQWLEFLDRITADNRELRSFLQRIAGYALTGSTREQALFFFYGTGANGKGVFIDTLQGILGLGDDGYATAAPMETFVATRNDRHPTDLASLRGARMVTAQETERGRHWAEAKVKRLTGGDPISARFIGKDFFTYIPAFKLIIAGNHKPGLRSVTVATRRRFNLVPFTVTIPEKERDQQLKDKLETEWPGILQWAIDGCLEWQRIGLNPPPIVREATDAYLASEDSIANWIAERCVVAKREEDRSTALFESWKQFAEATGETAGPQKSLTEALEALGFERFTHGQTRQAMFRGISVRPHCQDGFGDQNNRPQSWATNY